MYYNEYSHRSDVWSFGVLMHECYTAAAQPYLGCNNLQVTQLLTNKMHLPPAPACPPQLYGIMTLCWLYDPEERPTFQAILEKMVALCRNDAIDAAARNLPTFEEATKMYPRGDTHATYLNNPAVK